MKKVFTKNSCHWSFLPFPLFTALMTHYLYIQQFMPPASFTGTIVLSGGRYKLLTLTTWIYLEVYFCFKAHNCVRPMKFVQKFAKVIIPSQHNFSGIVIFQDKEHSF